MALAEGYKERIQIRLLNKHINFYYRACFSKQFIFIVVVLQFKFIFWVTVQLFDEKYKKLLE